MSSLEDNPALCGSEFFPSCKKRSHRISKKVLIIVIFLSSVSLILLLAFIILISYRCYRRRHNKQIPEDPPAVHILKRFTLSELEDAIDFVTEGNVIGSGNLSTIFKGRLEEEGRLVAVKKFNMTQSPVESGSCFYIELKTLSCLRPRNLVKVAGYAWETRKIKALVLEFMENGNLKSIMHSSGGDHLRWAFHERLRVCISVANGLIYMHSGYDFPIVYCDIKPSNILLDRDWEGHVSYLGISRMLGVPLPDRSLNSFPSAFHGTIGYIAPVNPSN